MSRGARGARCRTKWSPEDLQYLHLAWGEQSLRTMAKHLKRSITAIYEKAEDLELPMGPPRGWEYVTVAARRVGHTRKSLRALCARHGVPLQQHPLAGGAKKTKEHHHRQIVSTFELNEAVELEVQEYVTISGCARRFGKHSMSVHRWLRLQGISWPTHGNRTWNRIHVSVYAKAALKFATPETLAAIRAQGIKLEEEAAMPAPAGDVLPSTKPRKNKK